MYLRAVVLPGCHCRRVEINSPFGFKLDRLVFHCHLRVHVAHAASTGVHIAHGNRSRARCSLLLSLALALGVALLRVAERVRCVLAQVLEDLLCGLVAEIVVEIGILELLRRGVGLAHAVHLAKDERHAVGVQAAALVVLAALVQRRQLLQEHTPGVRRVDVIVAQRRRHGLEDCFFGAPAPPRCEHHLRLAVRVKVALALPELLDNRKTKLLVVFGTVIADDQDLDSVPELDRGAIDGHLRPVLRAAAGARAVGPASRGVLRGDRASGPAGLAERVERRGHLVEHALAKLGGKRGARHPG